MIPEVTALRAGEAAGAFPVVLPPPLPERRPRSGGITPPAVLPAAVGLPTLVLAARPVAGDGREVGER